tara:strand:- start:9567 stop:11780 length:2214 start_codon:yes stop_codon:yes gene_type:complete
MAEMQQRAKDRQYQIDRDKKEDERAEKLLKLREDAQKLSKDRLGIELSAAAQKAKADQKKAENLAKGMSAIKNLSDYLQFFNPLENKADYEMWLETYPTQMPDALLTEQTAKQYEGLIDLVEQGRVHRETIRARANKQKEDEARRERQNNRQEEISKRRVELGMPDDIDPEVFNSFDGQAKSFSLDISEGLIKLDDPKIIEFRKKFAEAGGDPVKLNNVFKEAYKPVLEREREDEKLNKKSISSIQDEAASVGTAGLEILNSIKPGPDGVYSQQDLIRARAEIAELKQDMDESPELKKNLNDAYGKLRADGSIKQYQLASGQLDQMREVKDLGTAAADIGMIFMFMKALDPTSVVREGEQATAQNATGVPDRIRNLYNNILSGNRLNATQRAEFFEAAEGSVTGLQKKAINVIDSFSDQFKTVYGKPHNFTPIRELVGLPKLVFSSQKDYEANKGNIQPGQEFIIKNDKGGVTTGTGPKKTSEASSQNESSLRGTREEIENQINAGKAEGRYKPGQKVSVIDPKTGKQVMLTVPGDMDQPDPASSQMAPTGTPEGQPAPRQLPEVEGEISRGQSGMQINRSPQTEDQLEPANFNPETYMPSEIESNSDEPTEGPKGPIPGADQGVEGEMEEAEDITPWESEEERQAMVDGQLQEYRAMQEFQALASNGGGENPYAFRRHRVKVGNTTGEIVRTNSRGVFIKIPNGPTRFMSWVGLSKRIESGDFKLNKARLNQQKGE